MALPALATMLGGVLGWAGATPTMRMVSEDAAKESIRVNLSSCQVTWEIEVGVFLVCFGREVLDLRI